MTAALTVVGVSLVLLLVGVFLVFGAGWTLITAGALGLAVGLLVELETE